MPSTPSLLVLQHGPDGPPGVLAEWLGERRIPFGVVELWHDPLPSAPGEHRAIVSLGSEHSAGAENPEWIAREIEFLREAVAAEVPVLGLCFGGQALAVALGGAVMPAPTPEVGWLPVQTADPDTVPAGPWLHFHWDAFRLPAGAQELARTAAGPAAFRAGPHLGTQFHPEATPAIAETWARHEAEHGRLAPLGLSEDALRAEGRAHGPAAAAQARRLFDAWWEPVRIRG